MWTKVFLLRLLAFCLLLSIVCAQQPPPTGDVDWQYARQLHQKEVRGEPLTPEEKAYLDRARKALADRPKAAPPRNPDALPHQAPVPTDSTGFIPLDQMSAQEKHKGEEGGLYGGGANAPPEAHAKAALAASAAIKTLDPDGKPSPDGKVVLLAVGMSNTANEFGFFKRTSDQDPERNPNLVVVNGAQGGQTASVWATPESQVWTVVEDRLKTAGVTAKQVQVVWLKQAIGGPFRFGDFPEHARKLEEFLIQDVNQVFQHYPSVRVIYLSSRIYGGYAPGDLNPEPYAYEGAFSVRWVIQDQLKGDARLNFDPARGEAKAPALLWGPYLWADGVKARKSDHLTYLREDLAGDGTHPSQTGQAKVAKLLTDFFKTDATARDWYLKPVGTAPAN